ncbi:hypothetical protein [Halovivax sp.]|uniref:DUF7344 domain-containing protein n=1 Tax=Halovivax sp. TaxID=1935978 RepID=UPI0025BBFF54|nr:hypothetical protein [Halovivax sp.]
MSEDELSQAELFDVFSNARRRMAVRFLKERNGTCDLAPLVEQVAAWENDVPPDEVTRAQRRRVYISLYQTHLPMLEEHGIVDWDPEAHLIELLHGPATFEPYLDRHPEDGREWHRTYGMLSIVGAIGLVLAWLSIGPLSAAATPVLAVALSGAFFIVATVQRVSRAGYGPVWSTR